VSSRNHFTIRRLMRALDVGWGYHELFMSRLTSQLTVDMLDTRATPDTKMVRLERCEAVALGRRRQIYDLLNPMLSQPDTSLARFVDPIDERVAPLQSRIAMAAIEGVLNAIQLR
jgi:hypothetical protein